MAEPSGASQRVAEPVRAFRGHFGPHHDELHPVSGLVHEQRLAVKVEQGVEPGSRSGVVIEISY